MFVRQIILSLFLIISFFNHSIVLSQIASNDIELERIYYGKASFYGDEFIGNHTANGEIYVHNKMTAAHRLWPFHTQVKVTNLNNRRSVIVRINDRGPFIEGRQLDVSKGVAEALGFVRAGVVDVRMEVISWGKDDPEQMARLANAEKAMLLSDKSINSSYKPPIVAVSSAPKPNEEPKIKEKKTVSEGKPIKITKKDPEVEQKTKKSPPQNSYSLEMSRSRWMCMDSDTLSGWCIQVGAFSQKGNAMSTYDNVLKITNDWVCIQEIERNNNSMYRVVATKTMDYDLAINNLAKIKEYYPEAYITTYLNLKLTVK